MSFRRPTWGPPPSRSACPSPAASVSWRPDPEGHFTRALFPTRAPKFEPSRRGWRDHVGSFEDIGDGRRQFFIGLLPAGFEVLVPVLRPGPTVVVDEAGIGSSHLLRPAIGVEDVAQA